MEFVLDNGSVRIALSTAGGSFTSIAANGREYLWQGDPAVWSGQAPICFPICGGLRDGHAMTMGGREINSPVMALLANRSGSSRSRATTWSR